jgi:DNA polymerase-1
MNNGIDLETLIPGGLDPLIYTSGSYVVVDFETTNLEHGDPRNKDNYIVLGHYDYYDEGVLIDSLTVEGGEIAQGNSKPMDWLLAADFVIAHNTKFEIGWLRRCGVVVEDILFFDTMIAQHVINGNRQGSLKLDDVAEARGFGNKLSTVSRMIKGKVCPSIIPTFLLVKYCARDVELTQQVFLQQLAELIELELLPVTYTRNIVTPILSDIERRGMHLDKQKVEVFYEQYRSEFVEADSAVTEFAGGINFNSPKQVAELLYDTLGFAELKDRRGNALRTKADGRKTGEEIIAKLKASDKPQRRFLGLLAKRQKLNAALSKNLDLFMGVVQEKPDGLIYANINQTGAQTHRLSSTARKMPLALFDGKEKGCQFQNIPRAFKSCFSARQTGWKIGERDSEQLEFRVAGDLGRDAQASRDVGAGHDVHQHAADVLTAAGQETDRQGAKRCTFKPLYGGQSGTKPEREYYDSFRERYPGITKEQERWKSTVERHKQLRIASGLIFYWPGAHYQSGRGEPYLTNTPSICNFPVQSFATADIIPVGVVIFWYLIRENGLESYIINTIHDSAITEEDPEETALLNELGELSFNIVVKEYIEKVYDYTIEMPLGLDQKTGDYWNG